MADPAPRKNIFEEMFDGPLVKPDSDDGMGPTVGGDVSAERQRREDARNGVQDTDPQNGKA